MRKGDLIFVSIIVLSFLIGSYIITAAFFGILTLVGLIALIESIPFAKYLASRSTQIIDIILFIFTIGATMNYGLNISASLTIAGLGYTLVYAPRLREQREELKTTESKSRRKAQAMEDKIDWTK